MTADERRTYVMCGVGTIMAGFAPHIANLIDRITPDGEIDDKAQEQISQIIGSHVRGVAALAASMSIKSVALADETLSKIEAEEALAEGINGRQGPQ